MAAVFHQDPQARRVRRERGGEFGFWSSLAAPLGVVEAIVAIVKVIDRKEMRFLGRPKVLVVRMWILSRGISSPDMAQLKSQYPRMW